MAPVTTPAKIVKALYNIFHQHTCFSLGVIPPESLDVPHRRPSLCTHSYHSRKSLLGVRTLLPNEPNEPNEPTDQSLALYCPNWYLTDQRFYILSLFWFPTHPWQAQNRTERLLPDVVMGFLSESTRDSAPWKESKGGNCSSSSRLANSLGSCFWAGLHLPHPYLCYVPSAQWVTASCAHTGRCRLSSPTITSWCRWTQNRSPRPQTSCVQNELFLSKSSRLFSQLRRHPAFYLQPCGRESLNVQFLSIFVFRLQPCHKTVGQHRGPPSSVH